MAFRLIKIISGETIIADAYSVTELSTYLKDTEDGDSLDQLAVSDNVVLLIDPVQVNMTRLANGSTETSLTLYMPYSEDFIIPVFDDMVVSITHPNKAILKAYNDYIRDYKDKRETQSSLRKKKINEDDIDVLLDQLNNLDTKKSTSH